MPRNRSEKAERIAKAMGETMVNSPAAFLSALEAARDGMSTLAWLDEPLPPGPAATAPVPSADARAAIQTNHLPANRGGSLTFHEGASTNTSGPSDVNAAASITYAEPERELFTLYEGNDGGAKYWIAARDLRHAMNLFLGNLDEMGVLFSDVEDGGISMERVSDARGDALSLTDEDGNRECSMREACERSANPGVIACSEW